LKKLYIIIILLIVSSNLIAQCLSDRIAYETYFDQNISKLNYIEGIWSVSVIERLYFKGDLVRNESTPQVSERAIVKSGNVFISCSTEEYDNISSKVEFTPTANPNIYLYKRKYQDEFSSANAEITGMGLLEYTRETPQKELKIVLKDYYQIGYRQFLDYQWVKIYPNQETLQNNQKTSGTGFAISTNGLIVTCNHVIENTDDIKVRGIDNNFSRTYKVKVIASDKNNDVAIIQIDDPDFKSIDNIPFNLSDKSIDVGSSVFALGYPLRSTMGDEIKLTNGIISAKSGYKGDITAYQISVPVQPGNSGGPLFDENGNIAGIINAKNTLAENASYAVKISYLKNLIETLSLNTDFPITNTLSTKTLPEKVKLLRNFTYIIECN